MGRGGEVSVYVRSINYDQSLRGFLGSTCSSGLGLARGDGNFPSTQSHAVSENSK